MSPKQLGYVVLVPLFLSIGCDVEKKVNNALTRIEDSIDTIRRQGADWQTHTAQLLADLEEAGQSTLRNEVDIVFQRAIGRAGIEFRCNVDFTAERLADAFERLVARWRGTEMPPPEPKLCNPSQENINLGVSPDRRLTITWDGWDWFDSSTANTNVRGNPLLRLVMVDKDGTEQDVSEHIAMTSPYRISADLGAGRVPLRSTTKRLNLYWKTKLMSEIIVNYAPRVDTMPVNLGAEDFTPPYVPKTYKQKHMVRTGGREGNISWETRTHTSDKDFKGHGPCVEVTATVRVSPNRRSIQSKIDMNAFECHGDQRKQEDYTRAAGSSGWHDIKVFPEGTTIKSMATSAESQSTGLFRMDAQTRQFEYTGAITFIKVFGDHGGDDAGSFAKVKVTYGSVILEVEKRTSP